MRVGREIRIEPELFTKGKKAVEHDIFHEVGHFMSSRLTKAAREEAEQYAGKIKTPVTEKYRRYLEEQSMAGIFSASLDRKMSDEQLAEMFRQHLQEGKHRSLVKRLKFTESAGEMPAPRPYKKGEKVQRIFGGEKQTGTVSAVQVHKPTGRQYIKLKGDKKWHPFDWWNPVENFDPNQPRDEQGRWTDEGGGGGVSVPTMAPADRSAVGPPKWSIAVGRTHQRYIRQFQDVLDRAGFLDRKHPLWFRDGQTGQGAEANYRREQAYENAPDSTPGIVLARRLGSSDTILHEYGHHVDWIMGGAQYLRYSEEQERGVYWSDRRLPEWIQFKGQVESENRKMCREIMADAFLHYVTKGTTSGLWVGGLKQGKTQEEFHTWLDAEFAKARDLFTTNVVTNAPGPKAFQFKTKDEKLKSFNRWFADLVNQGILEVDRTTRPWLAKYVESAYKKGAIRSYLEAHKKELGRTADFYAGTREQFLRSAFETPERMSKLKLLGTRAFEELKGISAEMSRQMSRVLADGMAHGKGPYEIARTMSNTITGIERKRAKVLARTEIIHAHAEGQLDGYEEMGVEEVSVDVEWSTAGDDLVCELCDEMEGEVFTIDEARGLIPKHPNCRCAWKPHLQKLKRGK